MSHPPRPQDSLRRYIRGGHRSVEGWLKPFTARYVAALGNVQHENGIRGASVEIGVHHGRLFLLLHLAGSGQRDLAIDVFADQHLNLDKPYDGDRKKFIANVMRHGGDISRIETLQKSSLDISADDILKLVGPAVLFSVDGGHTQQCAYNDLMLADRSLHPDGAVVLDDFFNALWPEVLLGAMQYFNDPHSRLRPFAVTKDKVYLCTPERNQFYRQAMRTRVEPWEYNKTVTMFGLPVDVMAILAKPRTGWRRAIAQSPIGAALKRLMRLTAGLRRD